ncbi:MAG: M20 family metallopeptidase [Flavobacteriales bacterium]
MIDRVKQTVARMHPEVVRMRRHLHAHPELSFHEHNTMAFVVERLRAAGLGLRAGLAGTGVIAEVKGEAGTNDRVIALRGDMDALPINEQNTYDYRSINTGVMHACGHDAHTSMVLGAGLVLHELRKEWSGTVQLVFQPGEEKIPGGASLLLKENAFGPRLPDGILGQHVTPELAVGKVGFCEGPFMASSDELYLTVKGRGGHAAQPEKLIDPIMIMARLLPQLKEEFAALRPAEKTVLAFGRVEALGATNVVPDEVRIAGTLRAFNETLREELHAWLPKRADEICLSMGGSCDLEVRPGYPVVVNDPGLTQRIRASAIAYLGAENVVRMDQRMGSEDFAFYTRVMPGCFFRLGTGVPDAPPRGLHTPTFDIDESALAIGCGVMVTAVLAELAT